MEAGNGLSGQTPQGEQQNNVPTSRTEDRPIPAQAVDDGIQSTPPRAPCSQPNGSSPLPGSYLMTLLQCCHSKVSVCYSCKQSLKPGSQPPPPPADLVIVTKMRREFVDPRKGVLRLSKTPSNVYFHCHPNCVQRQQPYFIPGLVTIQPEVKPLLGAVHRQYIFENFRQCINCTMTVVKQVGNTKDSQPDIELCSNFTPLLERYSYSQTESILNIS